MSAAIDNGNSEDFTSAFLEMAEEMQAGILENAKKNCAMTNERSGTLTVDVRQLLSKKKFCKGIECAQANPQQEAARRPPVKYYPDRIDAVFDDLKKNHRITVRHRL